eukprot:1179063-Prorocentrum_minimum.AAC.1
MRGRPPPRAGRRSIPAGPRGWRSRGRAIAADPRGSASACAPRKSPPPVSDPPLSAPSGRAPCAPPDRRALTTSPCPRAAKRAVRALQALVGGQPL